MDAAAAETHLSVVFLLGDRAWKLPKPVRMAFVDQSTPELRARTCRREVDLNRRLAPDVYLGVLDLVRDGEAVDHLIEMRRMPDDRRLTTLALAGGGHDEVVAVARRLAAFHAAAARSGPVAEAGDPDAVRRLWDDNLDELAVYRDVVLDGTRVDAVAATAHRYLDGRRPLFVGRIADGHVVDGHGDLLADDIFCLDDGPRILDCLAFDDRLRHGDVLLDLAMLVMDLERLGRADLADLLVTTYRRHTDEHHPASLAHHYVAYRALVRAKIACLRVDDEGPAARDRARDLLALCRRHLDRGEVRLVLVGGAPGSGKSTLAEGLAGERDWAVLSSDETRKDLLGIDHRRSAAAPFGEGAYRTEVTDRVHAALREQAGRLLAQGESVVLDASWTEARHRAAAVDLAAGHAATLVALECRLPVAVAQRRILGRGDSVSDADDEVAARLAAARDPWPDAVVVDTSGDPTDALAAALTALTPRTGA